MRRVSTFVFTRATVEVERVGVICIVIDRVPYPSVVGLLTLVFQFASSYSQPIGIDYRVALSVPSDICFITRNRAPQITILSGKHS